jgi:hypothetical protein
MIDDQRIRQRLIQDGWADSAEEAAFAEGTFLYHRTGARLALEDLGRAVAREVRLYEALEWLERRLSRWLR